MRFGNQKTTKRNERGVHVGSLWRPFSAKNKKRRQKVHPKIDAEKGLKISAEIGGEWSQNGIQNQ